MINKILKHRIGEINFVNLKITDKENIISQIKND
jgi:hypothetical protein